MFLLLLCHFVFSPVFNGVSFAQPPRSMAEVAVPLGGNAWISNTDRTEKMLQEGGIRNWNAENNRITVYVNVQKKGRLNISLRLKTDGKSKIRLRVNNQSFLVETTSALFTDIKAGSILIENPGYIRINLQGITKTGTIFADISDVVLSGPAVDIPPIYVKDNADNYFYWGRRGPSVHLGYQIPEKMQTEVAWFYNEITVPKGQDIEGSYYMANGFREGYFGMQVNSKTERRILFSVWSPFVTDDPQNIPDSMKIKLMKKGDMVKTGEFGNEGSGGQSYLLYNWEAGKTYRFLNNATPDGHNSTIYTAYFFDPVKEKWLLIASFKRPQTNTYLKGIHSFLENFNPLTGNRERMAIYHNQWLRDQHGNWTEITSAKFTGDQTARKNFRSDYAGGTSETGQFYLKNCGFFDHPTPLDQIFTRKATNNPPEISFEELP